MKQSETEIAVEIEQAVFSFFDICAQYETVPSIRGFINFLDEAYE